MSVLVFPTFELDQELFTNRITIKTRHAGANHEALAKFHPLGRLGEISDIVGAVLYLQRHVRNR